MMVDYTCPRCDGALRLQRTWRQVHLRCGSCGADYALAQFSRIIDEGMEEVLANIPCDRL